MRPTSSSNVFTVVSSLRVGERVLVRSDDGLLAAEYALFDAADIVLRASDPVSVREVGYMTTAREALDRLARAGITPELAEASARSLPAEVSASLARAAAVREIAPRLGPYELFEGAIFNAGANRYDGAWLDLGALANQIPVAGAPAILQALHLAVALAEVSPTAPIHMSTAGATRERRPGERTHARVPLAGAQELPSRLGRLRPPAEPLPVDPSKERRARQALLSRVRERLATDSSQRLRAHVAELELALGTHTMQLGPMGDEKLQWIERKLAGGDARGVEELLDEIERGSGKGPGTRYLRARAALLRGEQAPRSVAQVLSGLAQEEKTFHEAALGAARSWLAAGEDAHARFYARKLAGDVTAPDSERLIAQEILDETSTTKHSHLPPPVTEPDEAALRIAPARVPAFPSVGNVPPPGPLPVVPSIPPTGVRVVASEESVEPPVRPTPMHVVPVRYAPELVESLPLPSGAREESLAANALPKTALEARITMTRLSRDLARDYRLWYGKSLRCNVLAIDAMQQHLVHRFTGASIADEGVAWELRRHGALLSEILARALGGMWVDIGPSEPGYWAMMIEPAMRTLPIGRIYRFVALGHREKDLVSYYLDIEARTRAGRA